MSKDTPQGEGKEERVPFTHIINVNNNDKAYFATDFKDNGETVSFITTTRDGKRFRRTIAKTAIVDIAEVLE